MKEKIDIEALLKSGKSVMFHPNGGSMAPLFTSPNDYATVVPITKEIKRLDVIVYRRPGGPLVIHRVYKKKDNELYMVGDAQIEVEGPIPIECALGLMTDFTRRGKERSTDFLPYRMAAWIWMALRPLRGVIFDVGHFFKVIIKKLTGRDKK